MAETPMPDTPSGFALDVLDDLKADLAQALSDRDRLLEAIREHHRKIESNGGFHDGGEAVWVKATARLWASITEPDSPGTRE
jgi:hypothetical protein